MTPSRRPRASHRIRPASRRLSIVLVALATALIACSAVLAAAPAGAQATPTSITEGTVTWGVKESWRNYIGAGGTSVGDGATINGDGTYSFPVASGSYDEETETTLLQLRGWVHWQAYPDYPVAGHWGLYSTFKELEIEISPTAQVVRGTNIGYVRDDPGGELHENFDVVLAKLDISAVSTSFEGGSSTWTDIPAVAGAGLNLYSEGTVIDPVGITYVGPGGVPDLGEHLDTPGAAALRPGARWISDEPLGTATNSFHQVYVSPGGRIVHVVEMTGKGTSSAKMTITALDAKTMEPIGTSAQITYPLAAEGQFFKTAYDPETESIFYAVGGEGGSQNQLVAHVARWNVVTSAYEAETIGVLREKPAGLVALAWNPITEELAGVTSIVAAEGASTYVKQRLTTFKDEGGTWTKVTATPLTMPATGIYAGGTPSGSPFACAGDSSPCLGVLGDGSYVVAPTSATITVAGQKLPWPAIRVELNDLGEAETSVIEGTELAPSSAGAFLGYKAVSQGTDGSVVLHNTVWLRTSFARVGLVDGEAKLLEAPYEVGDHGNESPEAEFALSMATDTAHGWEWATDAADPERYVLDQVEGDELVGRFKYPEFLYQPQEYPALGVGADGSVYLPVKDEATGHFGYQLMEYAGRLATPDQQPADATVSLASGEASKQVSFASTVTGGEPSPTRQWQVREPGDSTFTDIEGQTGATATVTATAADNGAEYRALYTSAAGKIASAAATLTVEFAPRVVSQPQNRSVVAGGEATFLLTPEGNPEPTVAWQRRVGGFWEPISPADENFRVEGPTLTVLETNTEQSGAAFRAKLTNSAGTTYSRVATLTVTPGAQIPEGGIEVTHASLDWLGNEEMQGLPHAGGSNYFSAGVSSGTESTYHWVEGNAAIWQVAPGGGEAPASWATRAAHVSDGGEQIARLYGGAGRVEPDGSADITWQAAFSVNFYGGLVPFTIEDPELTIEPDGSGSLTATMVGCASSMANVNQCTPLAPAAEVVVANFTDATVEAGEVLTIEPEYAGVEVDVEGSGAAAQVRTGAGWGAWPQSFVDFQLETGLSSYWYSSGTDDEKKPPLPFAVHLEGPDAPGAEAPGDEKPAAGGADLGDGPSAAAAPSGGSKTKPGSKHAKVTFDKVVRLNRKGVAKVAGLACPQGGAGSCETIVPARLAVRIAGRRYLLSVSAPAKIKAGESAAVRVKLPRAARKALGDGRLTVRLRVIVRSGTAVSRKIAKVTITGKA